MKTLIIDTVNFTSYFTPTGYEVGYQPIDGGQGAVMLDGTTSVDELAVKTVITLPCYPLTESQLSTLLEIVMTTPTHTVQYYDPWRGVRTATFKRGVPKQKYRGKGGDNNEYWTGTVIELTEK